MAAISYFVVGPSSIVCLIALLRGQEKKKYKPTIDFHTTTVDIVIPAFNEASNIVFCLESILHQTVKPGTIFLVDDGSTDNTALIAEKFAQSIFMENIRITHKATSEGKTPGISQIAHESKADILFVLDADTVLYSPNYIERTLQELCAGSHIASACGIVMPETETDREALMEDKEVRKFSDEFPDIVSKYNHRWQRAISNRYRQELYLFLERFIYHGQMIYCGSLVNPVGCAVAYRRQYLVDIFDHYEKFLGSDLTTSEDIFIGFTFDNLGYRNVQIPDIGAITVEPYLSKLPKQVFNWSSSFLQCCYYYDDLVATPFKYPRFLFNRSKEEKKLRLSKEVVNETYFQPLGAEFTKKYGRPIGWFIFAALVEKVTFPFVFLLMMIFGFWEALLITVLAEVLLFSLVIATMYKKHRIRNFLTSILVAPVRYFFLLYDTVIIANFVKDLWITRNRKWRK